MARPRSESSHFRMSPRRKDGIRGRNFPWDEPDFNPQKVLAQLDQMPVDWDQQIRDDCKEPWGDLSGQFYSGDQIRSPSFLDVRQPDHRRHERAEELSRRRPPPSSDELGFSERRRFSPRQDPQGHSGREDSDRRPGFRGTTKGFGSRERSSPQRQPRERAPDTEQSAHQQHAPPAGWRGEDEGRGRGRIREQPPRIRSLLDDLGERGRGDTVENLFRGRQREDLHREKSPFSKRQRRDLDDQIISGYMKEEFIELPGLPDRPLHGLGGDHEQHWETQGGLAHGRSRDASSFVIEHNHGITDGRPPPLWDPTDQSKSHNPSLHRDGRSRQMTRSQERIKKSNSRSDATEEARGRPAYDSKRENRGSLLDIGGIDRVRNSPTPARGRMNRGERMMTAPSKNNSSMQQSPQAPPQDLPRGQQRHGARPGHEEFYVEQRHGEPEWETNRHDRRGILDRRFAVEDPKVPHNWKVQQTANEMMVVSKETLTIKVDMSQPRNKNSQMCYSSDRQMSLDLVNVGRQRLDFLPMLKHSGTYRENTMHTGTFAQEIITLVHQVKEQYFRGYTVTLNERFSAPQQGNPFEDQLDDLLEEEMLSLNRRFTMGMSTTPEPEPLFNRPGPLQLVSDPGDLRHDLERRRQERMEGVKVTIPGGIISQRPLGFSSEQRADYDDMERMAGEDDGMLSSWPEEPHSGQRGNMVQRRGAPFRQNSRLENRIGPMRRTSNRHNNGSSW